MGRENADSSDKSSKNNESDNTNLNDESLEPSRSQLRRDALRVRALAIEIGELSAAARAKLPLPEELVAGMEELDRISHKNARKRHIGFITKKMRAMDVEAIENALEKQRQAARAHTHLHHSIEQWRDRLMGITDTPDPKLALTEFVQEFPHVDRQQLSQLQRKVRAELQRQASAKDSEAPKRGDAVRQPPSARLLFQMVRDAVLYTE